MSKWFEDFHLGEHKVNSVIWYLEHLSELLEEFGNDKLAVRINRCHNDLIDGMDLMKKALDDNFAEQVKRSNEATANMIKACLAVSKMREEEEPNENIEPPEFEVDK